MDFNKAMSLTPKALKTASNSGGFFYFVSDAKGEKAALIVFDRDKDSDGKKATRAGRSVVKDFKKEYGKALFSQGEIVSSGGKVTFVIDKGNAKPAVIKRAFKGSDVLHDGVGAALVSVLKGAKLQVGRSKPEPEPESSSSASTASTAPTAPTAPDPALEAWSSKPEIQQMIAQLELDPQEVAEMFAAEAAFEAYQKALPRSEEEDTLMQVRLAETEALIDELSDGDALLSTLRGTDPAQALKLEGELNEKRIALAKSNPVGVDNIDSGELSPTDKQAFTASIRAGLELLLARAEQARTTLETEHARIQQLPEEEKLAATERFAPKQEQIRAEIQSLRRQLEATRRAST